MASKKKQKTKNEAIKAPVKKSINKTIWPDKSVYKLSWKLSAIIALIAIGLSFLIYGQTLPYEFVLDDKIVLSENSFVKQGFQGIDDLIMTESFVGYFGEQKDLIPGARYRPLSMVTFAIEYEIFGGFNSKVNHLINVLLYGLCGWLLFLFLYKTFDRKKLIWLSLPFLAFIIWMVHPVHSEVVANIKGRDEIMSLIFSLLCMLSAYWNYRKKGMHFPSLVVLGLCFFLGLLSKENVITFLAIIPATLYFFRAPDKKKMLSIVITMLISFVAYLALRYAAVGYFISGKEVTDVMNDPFVGMGFMERMATVFFVLIKYLGLSYVPYPLTHDYYPFQIPRVSWGNVFVLLSLLIHLGLALYAMINFRKRKTLAYIIFLYIASLSIYSNIVINVGTTMNERFLFTPTIATCAGLVLLLNYINEKFVKQNWFTSAIIGVISIVYIFIGFNRTQVWKNALTLNTAAVEVSTNSARANSFMGTALFNRAKEMSYGEEKKKVLAEALTYVNKSLKLYPDYYNANLMKAGIAGEMHKMDRDLSKLLKAFKEVAVEKPAINFLHEYIEYILERNAGDPALISFFYDVGYNELILKKQDYSWGLKFLNYAYEINPNDPNLNYAISQGYNFLGDKNNSDKFLSRTYQLDPSFQNR